MFDAILLALILVLVVWLICLLVGGPRMQCRAGMVTNFNKLRGKEKEKAIDFLIQQAKKYRSGFLNGDDIEEDFVNRLFGPDWVKDPEPVQLSDPNKPKPFQVVEAVYGGIPYYLYDWRDMGYRPEWGPNHHPSVLNSKSWFQKTLKVREADFWNTEREEQGKRVVDINQVLNNEVYQSPLV